MTIEELQNIVYEFIGCDAIVSKEEIIVYLHNAHIDLSKHQHVIERLCLLSFLGMEVAEADYQFVSDQDPTDFRKKCILSRKLIEKRSIGERSDSD